jgi:hypothetical protein
MVQFLSTDAELTLRLAQAMTIRVLPVNSSAPPTMTRIRPSEKTGFVRPNPEVGEHGEHGVMIVGWCAPGSWEYWERLEPLQSQPSWAPR